MTLYVQHYVPEYLGIFLSRLALAAMRPLGQLGEEGQLVLGNDLATITRPEATTP